VQPTDETFPEGLSPAEAAVYIAQGKAAAVQNFFKTPYTVIAADTIVVLDETNYRQA
jgi:septum formation protein